MRSWSCFRKEGEDVVSCLGLVTPFRTNTTIGNIVSISNRVSRGSDLKFSTYQKLNSVVFTRGQLGTRSSSSLLSQISPRRIPDHLPRRQDDSLWLSNVFRAQLHDFTFVFNEYRYTSAQRRNHRSALLTWALQACLKHGRQRTRRHPSRPVAKIVVSWSHISPKHLSAEPSQGLTIRVDQPVRRVGELAFERRSVKWQRAQLRLKNNGYVGDMIVAFFGRLEHAGESET